MPYISCDNPSSHIYILLGFLLLCVSSCGPTRNLVYLSDVDKSNIYKEQITNRDESKIQSDDLLSIMVTSLSPEANLLFNRGAVPSIGSTMPTTNSAGATPSTNFYETYLVDSQGMIDFPVLGKVLLGGLTRAQATEKLIAELQKYLKEPKVFIRITNFKVTVIGEVNNPSTFNIPTERVNILEALGMAGDMTPYGERETVLVIREQGGTRTLARVNMNKVDLLSSPYFYLQQNDVLYVEPTKVVAARATNADRTARLVQVAASVLSLIIVVVTQFFIK